MKVLTGKIVGLNKPRVLPRLERGLVAANESAAFKMPKTVTVEIESFRRHPLYKKIVRKSKKILAHFEGQEIKLGDKVRMAETRPISQNKHFKIIEVVK